MWEKLPSHLKVDENKYFISKRRLIASHRLCKEIGVDSNLDRIRDILSDKALSNVILPYKDLISTARDSFEEIQRTLADKTCIFILTDFDARIIEIFSSPEIILSCSERGIVRGASLKEKSCGTNAVALALRYREPVIIKGGQHFCNLFKDWYCIAVPILSTHGTPIACVDLSCSHEACLNEKYPLIKLLAEKLGQVYINDMPEPNQPPLISRCQHAILSLLAQGLIQKQIAEELGISPSTVETQIRRLRKKFDAKTTEQLMTIFGNKHIKVK